VHLFTYFLEKTVTETYVRAGKINWIAKGSNVGVQERTLAPGEVIPGTTTPLSPTRRTASEAPSKSSC